MGSGVRPRPEHVLALVSAAAGARGVRGGAALVDVRAPQPGAYTR